VTHPPGSGVTVGRSLRELRDPGEGTKSETDDDGVMHRTATIDYGVIVSGTISMALDDGTEVSLSAGDVIVQTGVRHGWLNYSSSPCVMAFVIVGAHQES
jgi:quercetin dioxygenase-like cupin family protein